MELLWSYTVLQIIREKNRYILCNSIQLCATPSRVFSWLKLDKQASRKTKILDKIKKFKQTKIIWNQELNKYKNFFGKFFDNKFNNVCGKIFRFDV